MVEPGRCVWLTGRAGAGKSTVGRGVAEELDERGVAVAHLDESDLSRHLGSGAAGGLESLIWLVQLLTAAGVTVIVTIDMPRRVDREALREMLPGFVEMLVDATPEACVARGAAPDPTYEEPLVPDAVIPTTDRDARASVAQLVSLLSENEIG